MTIISILFAGFNGAQDNLPGNADNDMTPAGKPPCCGRSEDTCCREDPAFWQTRDPMQQVHEREEWHPKACLCVFDSPPHCTVYSTRRSSKSYPDAAPWGCSELLLAVSGLLWSGYQVTYRPTYSSLWRAVPSLNCSEQNKWPARSGYLRGRVVPPTLGMIDRSGISDMATFPNAQLLALPRAPGHSMGYAET